MTDVPPGRTRARDATCLVVLALLSACAGSATPRVAESGGDVSRPARAARGAIGDLPVRVALATTAADPRVSGTGDWRIVAANGVVAASARAGESWRAERQGGQLRLVRPDGVSTRWLPSPVRVVSSGAGFVAYEGRRYRGELVLHATDSGVAVVDHARLDDYLKGVVPLEIGRTRSASERAAVEAQAVAARSYAYTRLAPSRPWDLRGSVLDQAYGGVDAETPLASAAVDATAGLVLRYGGRAVDAPYHASCGGATAAGSEVWRTSDVPYLRSVSDRVPGAADRYWCDAAPRFSWVTTFDRAALDGAVGRYLRAYAAVPPSGPGAVRGVAVTSRTASGRVGTLALTTDAGVYGLRGNEIRFVLRAAGSEILNSTYFSVESQRGLDGRLERLTLRGYGNGHGVGLCQWGAIGRARAGQDVRTILQAYYPGADVGPAY